MVMSNNERFLSFFEVVDKRVSVRNFKPDSVPKEDLLRILDTVRRAPNSGNQQACRYLVVQDEEKLEELKNDCIKTRESVLRARGDEVPDEETLLSHYNMIFSAPLFVLVLVDKTVRYKGYEDKDGSLAASHIMLAARALGYGTVFYSDSIPEELCRKHFNIPEKYSRTCIIPIGTPNEWPQKSQRKPLDQLIFHETL